MHNHRKRIVILVIGLFLLSTMSMALPKMLLGHDQFEFGYVPQNSKISHVFWIKSVGDDSLKILSVKPGCGCTQAPVKKQELAVGDSTDLEIIFSTGQYLGAVSKSPSIQTNEGPPARNVSFKCTVLRAPDSTYPIVIKPYRLSVSRAGKLEIDEGKVTLANISDQDIQVKVIDAAYDYFTVNAPKVIKKGASADLKIKLKEQGLSTPFEKSVTLELNDTPKSRFTIPVVRRLIGDQATDNPPPHGSAAPTPPNKK
jgi:hypothetical protein